MASPWRVAETWKTLDSCIAQLLAVDVDDDTAIGLLKTATEDHPEVLRDYVAHLEDSERPGGDARNRWRHDPLRRHIAELVIAAARGDAPTPLSETDRALAAEERRLLSLPPAAAYDELAQQRPLLRQLEATVTDPQWQQEARQGHHPPPWLRQPPPLGPSEMWPELSPTKERLLKIAGILMQRRYRKTHPNEQPFSLSESDLELIGAIGCLIRHAFPDPASSDDPLLRTSVFLRTVSDGLYTKAGLNLPRQTQGLGAL